MNFLKNPDKLIYILLAVCVAFYIFGIWYGLPYFFVGDEQSLIGGALKMLQLKNPFPVLQPQEFNLLYYPVLIPYVLNLFFIPVLLVFYFVGGFSGLNVFQDYLILNSGALIITARIVSVLFGLGLVFLIYQITKEIIKNSWASLLGATIFGLSFYQLQMSHFARHWIYTAFFAASILYCAIKIYFTREKKWYLLAGVTGGLSFGASYVGILYLVFVFWAHFFTGAESWQEKIKSSNWWYFVLVFVGLSFLFFAIYPQAFLAVISGGGAPFGVKSLEGFLGAVLYMGKVLIFMDPVITALVVLGLIYFVRKRKNGYFLYPALFLIVIYPALLYFIFHEEPRYIFLLGPIFAILAGEVIFWTLSQKNIVLKYGIVLVAIIFSLIINIRYDLLLTRSDTRILAKNWIEQNIPSGSSILVNFSQLHIPQTKESIQNQKVLLLTSLRSYDQAYLNSDLKNQDPQYFVLNSRFLAGDQNALYNLKSWYAFDYLVFERQKSDSLGDFENQMLFDRLKVKGFYSSATLAEEDFTGNFIGGVWNFFKVQNFGPEVNIYKTIR